MPAGRRCKFIVCVLSSIGLPYTTWPATSVRVICAPGPGAVAATTVTSSCAGLG